MNAEDEIEDDDGYLPEPVGLSDGDVVILDPLEFEAVFDCFAVMVRENCLFVLCKQTHKWVPAEGKGRAPDGPRGKLRTVQ